MILLALAAAAAAQWTGPRTEEYKGPGYFCGGGYAVHLVKGERALILPQGQAPQATRLVLSGGEVNILTGARAEPGKVVLRYGGSAVTEQNDGGGVAATEYRHRQQARGQRRHRDVAGRRERRDAVEPAGQRHRQSRRQRHL